MLSGKTVLVTGASRGIGHAIAREMLEEDGRVIVHYRKSKQEAETLCSSFPELAVAVQADLAELDDTRALFEQASDAFGVLDALVNNAGVWLQTGLDQSDAEWYEGWQKTMEVNVRAAEQLSRYFVRHCKRQGHGGSIINVASRAAFRGDDPAYMSYAASKAAMVALTRSIARGFGRNGITAFTLAPGFVRTDMTADHLDTHGDSARAATALGELTRPEDIAPTVAFLASGKADHATGSTIDLNAGSFVH